MAINESISKLKLLKNIFKGDKVIWTVFFVLCMVSIIEVYSSSSVLGYKSGNYWYAAVFHTGTLVFGMLLMVAISTVPCKYFRLVMPFFFIVSVVTLLWVLTWGTKVNGAARWIDLGLFQLQPSEFAKGTMVLVTAHILAYFQTPDGTSPKAFKNILIAGAFLILPIIPENFSTGFLLASVIFMMMLIGRVPARQIGKLCSVCAAGVAIFLIFAVIFEELGMAGAVLVVLMYLIVLFRTGYIARQCVNAFPAYLAMGLALLIVVQALFNMAVAVGLVPVTGQPPPLISKDGTSSIINCIYIGMIISVSKTALKREKAK